jgi:hypothetical protein
MKSQSFIPEQIEFSLFPRLKKTFWNLPDNLLGGDVLVIGPLLRSTPELSPGCAFRRDPEITGLSVLERESVV